MPNTLNRNLLAAAFVSTLIIGAAVAAPATTGTTTKGPALTDVKGMTLYTFDKDSDGKSACNVCFGVGSRL